jgi:hypothetical protein
MGSGLSGQPILESRVRWQSHGVRRSTATRLCLGQEDQTPVAALATGMDELSKQYWGRRTTMRANREGSWMLFGLFAISLLLGGCTGDVGGIVQVKNPDGTLGDPIAGATLNFTPEGEVDAHRVVSGAGGAYGTTLDTGRYAAEATHPDFVDLADAPILVVQAGSNTANFFMEPR